MSTNCESFIINSGSFCLFRKDYVCRITFSTEWLVNLETRRDWSWKWSAVCKVSGQGGVLTSTAGVQRPSCCAERLIGMSLLETEHWHNLSTILKRYQECYNSLFSLYCFCKLLFICKNYVKSYSRSPQMTVFILCISLV